MSRREYLLAAELLDQQLRDRDQRAMGMIDGLVLELREGEPPRVEYLAVGGTTLGRRLRGPVGRLATACAQRWGALRGQPYRIPWSAVRDVGVDVEVDLDARDTPVLHWEDWVCRHIIGRIPGA